MFEALISVVRWKQLKSVIETLGCFCEITGRLRGIDLEEALFNLEE